MKELNKEQRKFLEYLEKEYNCLGYDISIPQSLSSNRYAAPLMKELITEWKLFRIGNYHRIPAIKKLYKINPPTKYLNG